MSSISKAEAPEFVRGAERKGYHLGYKVALYDVAEMLEKEEDNETLEGFRKGLSDALESLDRENDTYLALTLKYGMWCFVD